MEWAARGAAGLKSRRKKGAAYGIDLRPSTWAASTPSIPVILTEMFASSHALQSASLTSTSTVSARSKAVTSLMNFIGGPAFGDGEDGGLRCAPPHRPRLPTLGADRDGLDAV